MPQIWDLPELTALNPNDVILVGNSANLQLSQAKPAAISGQSKNIELNFPPNLSCTVYPSNGNSSYSIQSLPVQILSLSHSAVIGYTSISGNITFSASSTTAVPLQFSHSSLSISGIPLNISWDSLTGFSNTSSLTLRVVNGLIALWTESMPVLSVRNNLVTEYLSNSSGTQFPTASPCSVRAGNPLTIQNPVFSFLLFHNISEL